MTHPVTGLAALTDGAVQPPLVRLHALLDGFAPGGEPVDLALGEPHEPPPAFVPELVREASTEFADYPATRGSDELRGAIAGWLSRRYAIAPRQIDPTRHVLPVNGAHEGLLYATMTAVGLWRGTGRPAVLIPEPGYAVYRAAALAANADPIPVPTGVDGLPDLRSLSWNRALLRRSALLILCTPSNPQGAVADRSYLSAAVALARANDFPLLVDECYSEIYDRFAPPGALKIAADSDPPFANVVILNSLSKRSNLPGLRSGFCAGDATFLNRLAAIRDVVGPQMPGPIQHASAAVWQDETHVEVARAAYRAKFDLADRILAGRWGYRRPAGGYFLWLDTGPLDGEEVALRAWRGCGVRVLPGAYLESAPHGPSARCVRLALVHPNAVLEPALRCVAAIADATALPMHARA